MAERHDTRQDKNFDDLAHRFQRNVYDRLKGQVRLAVIERDLAPYLAKTKGEPSTVIDAGGGQGQLAIKLALLGHAVTICDISAKMLALARQKANEADVKNASFIHCSVQDLPTKIEAPATLVLCHAVLEWMAQPHTALAPLEQCLTQGGILSLAFFNLNSLIFKNLVRGNYRKVDSGNFVGLKGSLTPINPLTKEEVFHWCEQAGLEIVDYSGVRVFHDYIADPAIRAQAPEDALRLELEYSRKDPFRSLGRYIHLVARKPSN